MALTFREVENVKDDEQFVISGKELKELLAISRQVNAGPDRIHYQWATQLTRIVCSAERCPDIKALVDDLQQKERTNHELGR
jgi:hypothetical protein